MKNILSRLKSSLIIVLALAVAWLIIPIEHLEAAPKFRLGLNADNWQNQVDSPNFRRSVKEMGIEFIVWHVSPEEFATQSILKAIEYCRQENLAYLFNTELVNYVPDVPVFSADDGQAYRWDLQPMILDYLREDSLFLGVVYDESLLVQNLLGATVAGRRIDKPYYVDTKNMSPEEAFMAVADKINRLSDYYRQYNKSLVLETLFPDSSFVGARGGAVLAVKLLKENYNDYMTMMAQSAARQYRESNQDKNSLIELWACVDLWYLEGFPNAAKHNLGEPGGHTPEDLAETLRFAYTSGYDAAYIEMAKGLMDENWNLTEHGQVVVDFSKNLNELERGDWREVPEGALKVRRFPSGNPGGRLQSFLDMRSYGSSQYRFQACQPKCKEGSGKSVKPCLLESSNPYCLMDLNFWAWLQEHSALKGSGDLKDFTGTTFNSTPYQDPENSFGAKTIGREYKTKADLKETIFFDHTAPPLDSDQPDQWDFYESK